MTTPAPRPCAVARGGAAERATWQLADDCLLLAGAAGTTALPLAEISAVAADDLTVTVTTPGEITTLSRLGADASFLAAELRTRWLPARAHALRLVGDGAPLQLVGAVAAPAGELFQRADLLLVGTNLVAAQHGHDVAPASSSTPRPTPSSPPLATAAASPLAASPGAPLSSPRGWPPCARR